MSQQRTPKNQLPLAHTTTHNTQQKTENTVIMVPPSCRLPAAPILHVSTIAVGCLLNHNYCNTAMYFFEDNNFSFIYFTIFLCAVAHRVCWLKVSFLRYISCFFHAAALKGRALTPAIRRYLIWQCRPSTHLVLFWFQTGGGGHCHDMFSGR